MFERTVAHRSLRRPSRPVACFLMACLSSATLCAQGAASEATSDVPASASAVEAKPQVDRAGILRDYAITLAVQQAYRLPREDVRVHLDGPFWRDYIDSISHLKQGFWDGDAPWRGLVAHPAKSRSYGHWRIRHTSSLEWSARPGSATTACPRLI